MGVVDLAGGLAVHARGGDRRGYGPVARVADSDVAGDAVRLACLYRAHWGITDVYVADLDAIAARPLQADAVRRLVATGLRVWLDAGVGDDDAASAAFDLGVHRVVVGLETLPTFAHLDRICQGLPAGCTAFSLDLRDGMPLRPLAGISAGPSLAPGSGHAALSVPDARSTPRGPATPEAIAVRAVRAGAGALIVLDLARVGAGAGLDMRLLSRIREAVPGVTLLVGGGVRHDHDVAVARSLGCDGVLVATALHTGAIHGRAPRDASADP